MLLNSPLSKALVPRKKGWPDPAKLSSIFSAVRSQVCNRKFRTTSFQIQAMGKTNDHEGIFQHTLYNCLWHIFTKFIISFASHTMSLNIDMKMILPVKFSGSHCNSHIICWIWSRIPTVVNPGKSSTRIPQVVHQFDSIRWNNCRPNTIEFCSSSIQRDCLPSFPNSVQNRRRRRLKQWNIDELDCATSLSIPTSNLGNLSSKCQWFLSDHWPVFLSLKSCPVVFQKFFTILKIHVIVFPEKNRCSKSGIHEHSPKSEIHIQIFHWIAKLSSINFPDHGEDGFHMMGCLRRYFKVVVPCRFCILLTFLVNWRTGSVCKGLHPSFIVLGNGFPFVVPYLSHKIVGVFWIFFFLMQWVSPLLFH